MKFLALYCAPAETLKRTSEPTPEEMEAGMKPWMEWAERCGDKLIDLGNPLVNALQINHGNSTEPGKREVAGYSFLEANNKDEALKLLKDHPHIAWNETCTIELLEVAPM